MDCVALQSLATSFLLLHHVCVVLVLQVIMEEVHSGNKSLFNVSKKLMNCVKSFRSTNDK